jgi:hypothetical protein
MRFRINPSASHSPLTKAAESISRDLDEDVSNQMFLTRIARLTVGPTTTQNDVSN